MRRPMFGVDRLPPEPAKFGPPCLAAHVLDFELARCVNCGWLSPDVDRCAVVGCDFPADYEAEVAERADPEFGKPLAAAKFCYLHWLDGGLSLLPGHSA